MTERQRVRVTADARASASVAVPAPETETARLRTVVVDGRPVAEVESVYVRGLVRAQFRLAIGCLAGFLVTAGALGVVLLTVQSLNEVVWFGVPLAWLLHAYGFYPIIFVFAAVYVRAASRNERRYRLLREREE